MNDDECEECGVSLILGSVNKHIRWHERSRSTWHRFDDGGVPGPCLLCGSQERGHDEQFTWKRWRVLMRYEEK